MKILSGMASGMVMQRNPGTNECDIHVRLAAMGDLRVTYKLRNALEPKGSLERQSTCKAQSALESRVSVGALTVEGDDRYRLRGIPCGGPYTVTISDSVEEVTLQEVYVGDVWLLAGQSNMEGAGLLTEREETYERNPEADVRAFYLDDHWGVAEAQLHQQWKHADRAIAGLYIRTRENSPWKEGVPQRPQRDGVGPGLSIGRTMKRYMGVPQGLIPCAFGGSDLKSWAPDKAEAAAFYPAMLRRFAACGSNVRGLFWYQGEAETNEESAEKYEERTKALLAAVRRDTAKPDLPIVLYQIAANALPGYGTEKSGRLWSRIREIQRTLPEQVKGLDVVATIDLPRDDSIHLSAAAAHRAGYRGARAMHALCGGDVLPMPQLAGITIEPDAVKYFWGNLLIRYQNLNGPLICHGNVSGFSVALDEKWVYTEPYRDILSICLEGDIVRVRTKLTCEQLKNAYLWYGAGLSSVCTITDREDLSLPAMGPVPVRAYLPYQ